MRHQRGVTKRWYLALLDENGVALSGISVVWTVHAHLFGRGHSRGLHSREVPGVDKIYAEIMRSLDIRVSWLVHLSNDIEISGTVTLDRRPGWWSLSSKKAPVGML